MYRVELDDKLKTMSNMVDAPLEIRPVIDKRETAYSCDGPVWEIFRVGRIAGSIQVHQGAVYYHPLRCDDWRYDSDWMMLIAFMMNAIKSTL